MHEAMPGTERDREPPVGAGPAWPVLGAQGLCPALEEGAAGCKFSVPWLGVALGFHCPSRGLSGQEVDAAFQETLSEDSRTLMEQVEAKKPPPKLKQPVGWEQLQRTGHWRLLSASGSFTMEVA